MGSSGGRRRDLGRGGLRIVGDLRRHSLHGLLKKALNLLGNVLNHRDRLVGVADELGFDEIVLSTAGRTIQAPNRIVVPITVRQVYGLQASHPTSARPHYCVYSVPISHCS